MDRDEMIKVLDILVDIQKDTAPIEVSIGKTVDGMVHHDFLVIKQAPAKVVSVLIQNGYHLAIEPDGVTVMKF